MVKSKSNRIRKRRHRHLAITSLGSNLQRRIQRIRRTRAAAVVIGRHKPLGHHLTIGNPVEIPLTPIRHRKRHIDIDLAVVSRTRGVIDNLKFDRGTHGKATGSERGRLAWGVIGFVTIDGGQRQHIVAVSSNE